MTSPYHSGSPSNHDDSQTSTKRRRIALACLDCRRRKVRCDRSFPACTRCVKGGLAAKCTYDPDAVDTITAVGASSAGDNVQTPVNQLGILLAERATPRVNGSPNSFGHTHGFENAPGDSARLREQIHQLENRIVGLERIVNGSQQRPGYGERSKLPRTAQNDALDGENSGDNEMMMFRGKNLKTQFYGASHHTSCLSHNQQPTLRMFMNEMIAQHPGLSRVQKELKSTKIQSNDLDTRASGDIHLSRMVPPREVADRLVQLYVDNFEVTYRILHLPSFWQEYQKFWNALNDTRPAFIALLLLILATGNCIAGREPPIFRGDSSLGREKAISWITACDSWLESQSQKHTHITIFQIHCASFIAKEMNCIKRKRTWIWAGNLLRTAMTAGLHRDAEIVNIRHATLSDRRVSVFDQEMRRRIWSTVSELELQTTLDRGMPATTRDLIIDCGAPLNIADEDFSASTSQLPEAQPISQYTRSSFQHILQSSWALRLELTSLINGVHTPLEYEDVLNYDRKIMQHLNEIPEWPNTNTFVPRTVLQIQLYQFLLLLHLPFIKHKNRSPRYEYSTMIHLKAAMIIVDLHHSLTNAGTSVFFTLRHDVLGAALSICYNFSLSDRNQDQKLMNWSMRPSINDSIQCLERALTMTEMKIMRIGVGIQEFYCICAAIGLLKRQSSDDPRNSMFEAAETVSRMIQRMLSLEDNFSAAATLASLPNMPGAQVNGSLTNGNGLPASSQANSGGLLEDFGEHIDGFDLTNMSGWDLEAFFNF